MNKTGHTELISLNSLEVGYRRHGSASSVFGPVSANIRPREMVSLIGRNGIGKSTLLRTLSGLQPSLKGDVNYSGISIRKIRLKEMAHLVSFVSTEPVFNFQLKVHEIIALGRFPHTGWMGKLNSEDHEVIDRAVHQTGIKHLLHKPVFEISDGERQKVMIARALAQDTPVIILDEPTAFLDLPSRYEILQLLHELTLKGKAIIFSTHDLNMAMDIADKIWLLSGRELYEGSPEDLIINDVFRKLFESSPVQFDPVSIQFRFLKEATMPVRITGDDQFKKMTIRALKRTGFYTDDLAEAEIEIRVNDEKPCWYLKTLPGQVKFESLYELAYYLRNEI